MASQEFVSYPSVEGAQDPLPWLEHLRAECPVWHEPGTNRYFLTRYEDVAFVLKTPSVFSNVGSRSTFTENTGHPAPNSMGILDPPEHDAARRIAFAAVKPGRLRRSEAMIRSTADELIDEFIDRGHAELVDEFAGPLVALVTCEFLGLPTTNMREVYLRVGKALEGSGIPFLPPERQARDRQNWAWALNFVRVALAERVERPADDGLSLMIKAQIERDGAVDLDYLRDQAATVFLGGLSTTLHLITSTILALLDNPDQMRKVADDHALIPNMVEEVLRLHSPLQWNAKRVVEDVVVGGVEIPHGSMVYVMYGIANREPSVFECPAHFDVERENAKAHLSFGMGIHFCLGAPLARLEAKVAIERLVSRVSTLRLRRAREDVRYIPSPALHGVDRLDVEFDRLP